MRRLAGILVACAIATSGAPRLSAADDLPPGKLGLVIGLRNGVGELADSYGLGIVYGIEAAWQPMSAVRRIGLAVHWSVLWGDFDLLGALGRDSASLTGSVEWLELDAGFRLRVAPRAGIGRYLTFGAAASLLRSNVPLPPDDKRSYVGPSAGLGVEQYFASGKILVSAEVRYGIIGTGPGALSFFVCTAIGI